MGIVNSTLKKKKQEKINELDILNNSIQHLKHYEKKNNQEINKMISQKEKIKDELEKFKSIYLKHISMECKICFDNVIDTIIIPCGHCYCRNCSNNMSKCYICQQNIQEKYKIFV